MWVFRSVINRLQLMHFSWVWSPPRMPVTTRILKHFAGGGFRTKPLFASGILGERKSPQKQCTLSSSQMSDSYDLFNSHVRAWTTAPGEFLENWLLCLSSHFWEWTSTIVSGSVSTDISLEHVQNKDAKRKLTITMGSSCNRGMFFLTRPLRLCMLSYRGVSYVWANCTL